jgi:DNA (cytosine-5)-methyltransferase 1
MTDLVLSLFPGIGLLDMAFEQEGFCVVRGPDVLWGGDIRRFHPPPRRFDGVIGGPPCQEFSRLAGLVRANGHEPKFGNLIPEFERCVGETEPDWFVMENVEAAPAPEIAGYGVHAFCLNNRQLGEKQNRVRRWSFGWRGSRRILMVETRVFEHPVWEPVAVMNSAGRRNFKLPDGTKSTTPLNAKSRKAFELGCKAQGLPDGFDLPPFTVAAKCQAVGNGVPLAMGRAIAKAVRRAIGEPDKGEV